MAAMAETHYVAVAPYHDGGPIGTAGGHSPGRQPAEFLHSAGPAAHAEQDAAMRAELTSGNQEIVQRRIRSAGEQAGPRHRRQ